MSVLLNSGGHFRFCSETCTGQICACSQSLGNRGSCLILYQTWICLVRYCHICQWFSTGWKAGFFPSPTRRSLAFLWGGVSPIQVLTKRNPAQLLKSDKICVFRVAFPSIPSWASSSNVPAAEQGPEELCTCTEWYLSLCSVAFEFNRSALLSLCQCSPGDVLHQGTIHVHWYNQYEVLFRLFVFRVCGC